MPTIKEKLTSLFKLDKMEPEKMEETLNKLSTLIMQAVLTRVVPTLNEEDLAEYDELLEKENAGLLIFDFLNQKIENLDQIIDEEALILKTELAKNFKEAELE